MVTFWVRKCGSFGLVWVNNFFNEINHFKVNDAMLQGVQNYWGDCKIYSKFTQFLWITNYKHQLKEFTDQIWEMKSRTQSRK